MPQAPTTSALRYIRKLIGVNDLGQLTDRQLLQRFLSDRDEEAFAVLMERHGPLVFKVCRQVLHHEQDAEDAFQATFLVLARHAGSIRQAETVGSWLYRVAYRIATKAGVQMGKRRIHEREVGMRAPVDPNAELAWRELQAALSQELNRLPEKYRAPFVLCCLEGKSGSEAARQLGWKEGTVSGRLAEARRRLQQRLSRRGITLSAILCAMAVSQQATAALPAAVVRSTIKAAQWLVQGKAMGSEIVSARVAALVQGVSKAMLLARLKIATVFLLAACGIGISTGLIYCGVLAQESQSQQYDQKTPVPQASVRNLPLASNPQAAPIPKTDKERVQGAWRVVSVEFNGQDVTKDVGDMKWFFKADQMTYSLKFLLDDICITFKLESTGSPKSVDFILKNPSQAETLKGIYELKDDELKVCVHVQAAKAQERPAEFKTQANSNFCLFVLKREKADMDEAAKIAEAPPPTKPTDATKAAPKTQEKANGIVYLVNEELMIVQPDGKGSTQLPTKAKHIFCLRVSHEGKRLAYTAVVNGKFKTYVTDLFSESSLISRVARLADIPEGDALDGELNGCVWTPDGKKLICSEGEERAVRHWIVDLKTKQRTELRLPEGHWLQDWAPDGNRFLTFRIDKRSEENTESHVSLVKKDGTEARRLSNPNQRAWFGRFSPDGRRALYTADEGPKTGWRVFVVDLPEGKPRPVSPELNAFIDDVCWSPDGKRIAYAWHQQRANPDQDDQVEYVLSVIDADGKNPVTLRTDKGREGPPVHLDWREPLTEKPRQEPRPPVGKGRAEASPEKANGIVYLVNEELMIVQPDGKDVRRLPPKAEQMLYSRVSPDGKQLVYTTDVTGKRKTFVTRLFAEPSLMSKVLRLTGEDVPEGDALEGEMDSCLWSPDGQKLICRAWTMGTARNWILDLNTKEKTEIHLLEADRVQDLSPDGNWYLTIKIDKRTEEGTESHVSLARKDGSEVRRLSNANQRAGWARFSPDGRRALYTAHEEPKPGQRVFVVDLPEGKPRPVSPELNAFIRDVCWSPDGKRIAYAWHQLRPRYDDDQIEYVLSVIDADGKNPVTFRTDRGRAGPAVHLDWR